MLLTDQSNAWHHDVYTRVLTRTLLTKQDTFPGACTKTRNTGTERAEPFRRNDRNRRNENRNDRNENRNDRNENRNDRNDNRNDQKKIKKKINQNDKKWEVSLFFLISLYV